MIRTGVLGKRKFAATAITPVLPVPVGIRTKAALSRLVALSFKYPRQNLIASR
jgi:hypothetical protein